MDKQRLAQQIDFLIEIDKLKTVLRRTLLTDGSRQENAAEHSWHLAVMALLLAEYANEPVEAPSVVRMLLVHDLVEIYAGDTFAYDSKGNEGKEERERQAAARLFSLLPGDQTGELRALWEEFEAGVTPEARFANALDRLHPLIHNHRTEGGAWKRYGVTSRQVLARVSGIAGGSEALWEFAKALIADAVDRGFLPADAGPAEG